MILFSLIGTLIGAGFASGQEIYLFFYRYGIYGIYGIAICSSLIGLIIYKVLRIINDNNIDTYKDFLKFIFRENNSKRKYLKISYIMNIVVNMFLISCFFIMIAGFGAYFNQEFGLNVFIGSTILSFISFIIFMTNIKGVTRANSVVVPLLIIIILFIGIKNWPMFDIKSIEKNIVLEQNIINNWFVQSIIYTSYNLILVIPLMVNLKKYIKSKNQIILISILTGGIIFLLALSIYLLLLNNNTSFQNIEMPAVHAISMISTNMKNIYGIVILLSIFTTSISLGISFLENIVKNKKYYTQITMIMCITAVLISNFGFSNLVSLLFPMFGILGLLKIGAILFI